MQAVGIDDGDKGVELEMRGGHGGFPDGALVTFAIAHQDIGVVKALHFAAGESDTDTDGEAVTEAAAGNFHAFFDAHGGLAGEQRVRRFVGVQFFGGEEAGLGQAGVECEGSVAFTEQETVALGPERVFGIKSQDGSIEDCADFDDGERRAYVRALRSDAEG